MKKEVILIILFFLTNINIVCGSDKILLKSRQFTPERGISSATKANIEAIPGRAHVLIQLEHIPTIAERKEFEAKGIKLLSYIPNKAWFASIASDKAGQISALSNVRAISEILPEDKISPHIIDGEFFEERVKEGKLDLIVEFFKDVSLEEAELVIIKYRGNIVGRVSRLNAFVVTVQREECINLALEETIKWIEQELPLEKLNNGIRAAIYVDTVQDQPYNLDGNDVDVLVYDEDLVDDTHDDFGSPTRVTWGEPGFKADHATHVAGTLGGDGTLSGGTYRGMAPAVDIISYFLTCPGPNICLYDDSGCMADLEKNFYDGINDYGVDIGTASVGCQPCQWGMSCDYEGDYCKFAELIDTIIYDTSIPITWAAGNDRNPGFPCERECGEYGTIIPTSTAKNAIIVGATNSNDDSMTTFSSWGPTDDGRIKPDIVAPGCEAETVEYDLSELQRYNESSESIWSTWYRYPQPLDYHGGCGTSMTTPAVAGSVALMLEDWRDTHTGGDPLPSTIKAILIQTATDLGNTGPDYSHGYGLINVKDAIDLIDDDKANNDVILEDSIVEKNDRDHFTVVVAEEQELKITLVWDDYPGDPAASEALVNDLDLIVRSPDGSTWYPWTLDPENPEDEAETDQPDHLNNVEQVYVASVPVGAGGTWTLEINGYEIPQPDQTYSLVTNNVALSVMAKPSRFYVRDAEGHEVAWFDDEGNLFLKGTLDEESTPTATGNDEFRVQDSEGNDVAIIDATNGNMYITGEKHEDQNMSLLSPEGFIIKNSNGDVVAYIDDSGDETGHLYLTGKLYENP